MLFMVCLAWAFLPEQVSAEGGSIMVNGTDILRSTDHTVPCGSGRAVYDEGTNTLILQNAVIGQSNGGSVLTYGVEIRKEGVTVRLEGDNSIDAYLGICSDTPFELRGVDGGNLAIHVSRNQEFSIPCSGIRIDAGGLTVRDAKLRITMDHLNNVSGYGIYICGGDNSIVNSQIEITGPVSAPADESVVGINGTGANSLTISNKSQVIMPEAEAGVSVSGKLTLADSALEIGHADRYGITCGNLEILNSHLTAPVSNGLALHANEKITLIDSEANVESKGTNALLCANLEVINSALATKGYWPALFVENHTVIRDSSVNAESKADVGIFNRGGNLEITGSKVNAVSQNGNSGILTKGDLTISDSAVTVPGNAGVSSIQATGSFSVTGGTMEIGAGSITAGSHMQIGGIITSNGTVSFDSINSANGSLTFAGADYSRVDAAIAAAQKLKREDYKNFEIVDAAISAVVWEKDFREQETVNGYAAAIEAAVAALEPIAPAPIIEGADQTAVIGENNGVVVKVDWAYDKFVSVSVDGNELAGDCYKAEAGSTIITLRPEYVNTLSPGNHIVGIRFTDGLAQTTLTMKEKETSENPPQEPGGPDSSKPESSGSSGTPNNGASGAAGQGTEGTPDDRQPEDVSALSAETGQSVSQNLLPGQKLLDKSPYTGDQTPVGWLLLLMVVSAMGMAAGKKRI